MTNWRFEPVFNIGNLVSVLLMIGGLVGVYIDIKINQTRMETRISVLEQQMHDAIETFKDTNSKLNQIQIDVGIIRTLYEKEIGISDDKGKPSYSFGRYGR